MAEVCHRGCSIPLRTTWNAYKRNEGCIGTRIRMASSMLGTVMELTNHQREMRTERDAGGVEQMRADRNKRRQQGRQFATQSPGGWQRKTVVHWCRGAAKPWKKQLRIHCRWPWRWCSRCFPTSLPINGSVCVSIDGRHELHAPLPFCLSGSISVCTWYEVQYDLAA